MYEQIQVLVRLQIHLLAGYFFLRLKNQKIYNGEHVRRMQAENMYLT